MKTKKTTEQQLADARAQLVNAAARSWDNDFIVRMGGRMDADKIKARIERLERKLGAVK